MTETNPTPAGIAAVVKEALRVAGISHEQAAAAIGIERQTLNRRLNGHSSLRTDDLVVIANLLNIDVRKLIAPAERGTAA